MNSGRKFLARCRDSLRRAWHERRGSDRYSRPALHDLDRKLERHLDIDGGYFVEAGANDGFAQSNTYYFERLRGWRGVLIEPDPGLYARCRRRRPGSITVHAALVAEDFADDSLLLHQAGLMSLVEGAMPNDATARHLSRAREFEQPVTGQAVRVPARTLNRILAEAGAPHDFDLLSLDVEGYEPAVLAGFNLDTWRPRFICIEVRDRAAISARLDSRYQAIETLHREADYEDILFRRR